MMDRISFSLIKYIVDQGGFSFQLQLIAICNWHYEVMNSSYIPYLYISNNDSFFFTNTILLITNHDLNFTKSILFFTNFILYFTIVHLNFTNLNLFFTNSETNFSNRNLYISKMNITNILFKF